VSTIKNEFYFILYIFYNVLKFIQIGNITKSQRSRFCAQTIFGVKFTPNDSKALGRAAKKEYHLTMIII